MTSMDDRRMTVAGDELCELFGIAPLAEIVIGYARYSEAELVTIVLMAHDNQYVPIGEIVIDDVWGPEFCWIKRGWISENQYKFSIGFRNLDSAYQSLDVTIDDLLPSRRLKLANIPDHLQSILDGCLDQYIEWISDAMLKI